MHLMPVPLCRRADCVREISQSHALLGVSVRHCHLHQAAPVQHRPQHLTILVAQLVQNYTLTVIEPHTELPLLPGHLVTLNSEAGALRGGDQGGG